MCVRGDSSVCVRVDEQGERAVARVSVCANVYSKVSETKNEVPSLSRIKCD